MILNLYATAGFNRFTGYGKLEHGIVRGLDACGVSVVPLGPIDAEDFAVMPQALREKLIAPGVFGEITVVTALPQNCEGRWDTLGKKVWLYTMSESDRVSEQWVELINATCTGVFVPCEPLVEIYRQSGITVPVVNIGMGVDFIPPPPPPFGNRPSPITIAPTNIREKFIFLTYSYGDMRKGAHKAILAFKKLYGDNPKFELWVKTRDKQYTWLEGCEDEQVHILEGDWTEGQWYRFLQSVNCFVFPSYGEGFGLPPREATLCGVPTITTQALGMVDVGKWGFPVGVDRWLPAQFDSYEANAKDARWAEPNQDDLETQMQWVVANEPQARRRALAGREYLLHNCTWAQTAKRMVEVLSEHHATANG